MRDLLRELFAEVLPDPENLLGCLLRNWLLPDHLQTDQVHVLLEPDDILHVVLDHHVEIRVLQVSLLRLGFHQLFVSLDEFHHIERVVGDLQLIFLLFVVVHRLLVLIYLLNELLPHFLLEEASDTFPDDQDLLFLFPTLGPSSPQLVFCHISLGLLE